MNFTYKIKKNLVFNINNTLNILYSLRYLDNDINKTISKNNENKKKQLRELYIYIGALVALIIIILGGFALYRKYIERKLMQEFEEENQMIINIESSSGSSSQENNNQRPYSYNNGAFSKNQNYDSEMRYENNHNKSYDFNHEERMENIRKKYGNSMLIKILLNKVIEEIIYNKTFQEEYEDNCTICMENFINNMSIYKTPCEHFFHKECFNKYLKNIKDKDKLICPNCNQNLLINKKFLKLRVKPNKINIEQNKIKIINIKLNKNKSENKDLKNNHIDITSKNNDNEESDINYNKESLIIIKKRKNIDKTKSNTNENLKLVKDINIKTFNSEKKDNIYNPKNDLEYKNTEMNQNEENEKDAKYINIKKENKNKKEKEKKIIFGHLENEKNDINSNIKESVINLNMNKIKNP